MSGIRLQEKLYDQTGKEDEMPRDDEKSVSHLLECTGKDTVKKKIVYSMEIKTLLYFRVWGK